MDIGFIDHHDGALGFVLDKVLDVGMRRERARRIIGIADVEHSGIRSSSDHGLDVVSVSLGERNLHYARLDRLGRMHPGFVTGIGGDVASLG